METVTQINVRVGNTPGVLASACASLLEAGVSIRGMCAFAEGDSSTMHFVVDNTDAASAALAAHGDVSSQEVLQCMCSEDKPGVIGSIAKACQDAGVNMQNIYTASAGAGQPAVIYVVTDPADLETASAACAEL